VKIDCDEVFARQSQLILSVLSIKSVGGFAKAGYFPGFSSTVGGHFSLHFRRNPLVSQC
jgi:hypothetical protein